MREEGTSEENQITREVPKAKVQLVNKKTSTFGETSSGVQWRPLRWWVPGVEMAGCLAVE